MSPAAESGLTPVFALALPHGRCVAMAIPALMTAELAAALHPDERQHLAGLPAARQPSFAAGRVALHRALLEAGLPDGPLLPGPRGAPTVPAGALGSISHKRELAVALTAPARPSAIGLGVDLEDLRRLRVDISHRVLTEDERRRWAALPPGEDRDHDLIRRFSLKESVYKAVNAFVDRYVPFHHVEVGDIDVRGGTTFSGVLLDQHPLTVAGWVGSPIPGLILSSAYARLRGPE